MRSVKTKITILVLCGIIFSTIAIGGASIAHSRKIVSMDSSKIMNFLCENTADEIDALLLRIEQSVETLSMYAVQQLKDVDTFKSESSYVDIYSEKIKDVAINAAENTEGALTVYVRFNPEFTDPESGFFYTKKNLKDEFTAMTPTNLAEYDATEREYVGWFFQPKEKGKPLWLKPYFNKNIEMEMISYVVPFYVDNIFVGVVGMDVDFSVLKDSIQNTGVYESGYSFLTDNEANIIYHRDLEKGTNLQRYSEGEFRNMARAIVNIKDSKDELVEYTYHGIEKKAAFRNLRNDMRLVLNAPIEEIDRQANNLIVQIGIAVLGILILAIGFTLFFTKRLVAPLLELTAAAKKISDGELNVSIEYHSDDELGVLAESFRKTVKHLDNHISNMSRLAYRDALTGVKSKTAYMEMVKNIDEVMKLRELRYAVVVFDINYLKKANDTLGHDYGDLLIRSTSEIICDVFKQSPIYRVGGDEFVVYLENTDFDQYGVLSELFQSKVQAFNEKLESGSKLSVAWGIAVYSKQYDREYNDVFKRADSAMYKNKKEIKSEDSTRGLLL